MSSIPVIFTENKPPSLSLDTIECMVKNAKSLLTAAKDDYIRHDNILKEARLRYSSLLKGMELVKSVKQKAETLVEQLTALQTISREGVRHQHLIQPTHK